MDVLLKQYMNQWEVSEPKLITKTPTSHIYTVKSNNQTCVLKLYTETGRKFEAIGPVFLKHCCGNGVIDVFDYNDEACLLEYIDGKELLELAENNQDDEATKIIAKTLNKIHSTSIPDNHIFKSLETHMSAIFSHTEKEVPDIIKRAAKFARIKLNNQQDIGLLHGDIHHKNIMHHSQKGWLALDPQAIIGDRAYDCANTLYNPNNRPDLTEDKPRLLRQVDILSKEMDIDPQRILDYAYIHGALSSCWTKEDEGYYSQDVLNTSAILEPLISKN